MTAPPAEWQKLGLILEPDARVSWMVSHAMLPVPAPAPPNATRRALYVTGRNAAGCGQVGRCQIDLSGDRPLVSNIEPEPVVVTGPLGAFDDRGASASALVEGEDGRWFLYYTGWTTGVTVPFYVFVGLAVSEDGGASFRKVSRAPILERSDDDPFLTGHPAVLLDNGVWRMWYASGSAWALVDGQPRHYYHIKYAESQDGISWRRTGRVCIDYGSPDEYALARPWVVRTGDGYRMWYSRRGDAYRIGYAESRDGLTWERRDNEAGLDVSREGWDSEMIEYPCVFDAGGRSWMLYNGNAFGRSGVGCAVRPAASS